MTHADFNDLETRDYIFKIGDRGKGIQARYDENTDALIFPRVAFDYVYKLLKDALSQEPCICDSCKYKDAEWNTEPCDGCCGNHSGYEPCDDAISINAVDRFGVLNEIYEWTISGEYEQPHGTDILIKRINNMPSVQPSRKGHWILLDDCANSGYYCSECQKKVVKEGWSDTVKKIKFCPNCGARMESEEQTE